MLPLRMWEHRIIIPNKISCNPELVEYIIPLMSDLEQYLGMVGITAQGLDTISDGRIFFASPDILGGTFLPKLQARRLEDLDIVNGGKNVEIAGPVGLNTPLICPECDTAFDRYVLSHDYQWMNTLLYCPNHPFKVWLDFFLKDNIDTSFNWLNAFYGFAVDTSLPEGVVITPSRRPDEDYQRLKIVITSTYFLTPLGVIDTSLPAEPSNLQVESEVKEVKSEALGRWRIFFSPLIKRLK